MTRAATEVRSGMQAASSRARQYVCLCQRQNSNCAACNMRVRMHAGSTAHDSKIPATAAEAKAVLRFADAPRQPVPLEQDERPDEDGDTARSTQDQRPRRVRTTNLRRDAAHVLRHEQR